MHDFEKSLGILIPVLENHHIEYMIFGGVALAVYGCPRLTFDIDIKIMFPHAQRDFFPLIEMLAPVSKLLPEKPETFIKETNVLPFEVEGVRFDLVIAELPFEKEAIRRSRRTSLFGIETNVCTPEDFIIQKVVSTREKDWIDIRTVIEHHSDILDWTYVMKHCRNLSRFLNDTDIMQKLERMKNEK